ncbi:MAG: hypothetical protein BWX99_02349 [Deltaproteobacteria bacterium ADurb.Bin151]|nr:MAG: hypothetical protein BWX99_02349 [Deltaproteobacteria bacterium ADurb.Bin151]
MQNYSFADDAVMIDAHVCIKNGVFADAGSAPDKHTGINDCTFFDGGSASDKNPGHDRCFRGYAGALFDNGIRMDARRAVINRVKYRKQFREGHIRVGHDNQVFPRCCKPRRNKNCRCLRRVEHFEIFFAGDKGKIIFTCFVNRPDVSDDFCFIAHNRTTDHGGYFLNGFVHFMK